MLYNDLLRQFLLAATGSIFLFFSFWAIVKPNSLAHALGYQLNASNAISEFHAIYIGVFLAQALLCACAVIRIEDVLIGNLVAVFLLSQPLGRGIALIRNGRPTVFLLILLSLVPHSPGIHRIS